MIFSRNKVRQIEQKLAEDSWGQQLQPWKKETLLSVSDFPRIYIFESLLTGCR